MGFDFQFLFQNKPTRGYITRGGVKMTSNRPYLNQEPGLELKKIQQVWNVFILNLQHERLKFFEKIEIF